MSEKGEQTGQYTVLRKSKLPYLPLPLLILFSLPTIVGRFYNWAAAMQRPISPTSMLQKKVPEGNFNAILSFRQTKTLSSIKRIDILGIHGHLGLNDPWIVLNKWSSTFLRISAWIYVDFQIAQLNLGLETQFLIQVKRSSKEFFNQRREFPLELKSPRIPNDNAQTGSFHGPIQTHWKSALLT